MVRTEPTEQVGTHRAGSPAIPRQSGTRDAALTGALASERLEAERLSAAERLGSLQRDWTRIVESSTSVATDDEHDPEGATIAFERSQLDALLEQTRQQLADLEEASGRLQSGAYGDCEGCGEPIAAARLAARPAARTCITCASARR